MPGLPTAPLNLPAPTEPVRSLLRSATPADWPSDGGSARPGPVQPDSWCVDGRAGVVDPCGTGDYGSASHPTGDPKPTVARTPGGVWSPYVVWAGDVCSAFAWSSADFSARARGLHRADRSRQIARELWTGEQANASGWDNQALASADATIIEPGGNGITSGLAALEQALADCAPAGAATIHASPYMATMLRAAHLVEPVGVNLITAVGTLVIVDAGYTGSAPTSPDTPGSPSEQWLYGTSTVYSLLGPVELLPDEGEWGGAVDRSVNLIEWRAESLDLAVFDGCCHLAVEIDPTTLI